MADYGTMRTLIACPDKESLITEVNKLTESEAKSYLIMAILSWKNSDNTYKETCSDLRKRIAELENK